MKAKSISGCINTNRLHSQRGGSPRHTDRDFASIGNQHALQQSRYPSRYSTGCLQWNRPTWICSLLPLVLSRNPHLISPILNPRGSLLVEVPWSCQRSFGYGQKVGRRGGCGPDNV